MSDAENARRWAEEQDRHAAKQAQQVVADWMERQDKLKPDGGDLNDALAELVHGLDELAQHARTDYHTETGILSPSDAAVEAYHPPAYDPTMAIIAVGAIVQKLNDAVGNIALAYKATGEKTFTDAGKSIGEAFERLKDDVVQVVEDVVQQIKELVSPEKAPGPDLKELEDKQAQDREKQAAQIEERRELLEQKYAESAKEIREAHLETFDDAAEKAATALAIQQAAERQRAIEEQQRAAAMAHNRDR
jgi:hypothetical protein